MFWVKTCRGMPLLLALILSACTSSTEKDNETILMLGTGPEREMSRDQLAQAIRQHDIILAGETHDNPWHHEAQANIVRWAALDGRPVVAVFEMLGTAQQDQVDRFLGASGTAENFPDAVSWEARGWPPAEVYQPLFDALFDVGARIIAADLSQETIRAVSQDGISSAPENLVSRFALDTPPPQHELEKMREIQFQGHCGLIPREALDGMVLVQRLRDAALASAIMEVRESQPTARIILISGRGHVRKDHAVAALLQDTSGVGRVLTVGLVEQPAGQKASVAPQLSELYDILWALPSAERADPCEELRARFNS